MIAYSLAVGNGRADGGGRDLHEEPVRPAGCSGIEFLIGGYLMVLHDLEFGSLQVAANFRAKFFLGKAIPVHGVRVSASLPTEGLGSLADRPSCVRVTLTSC